MKKFFITIMVAMIGITMLTRCGSKLFTTKMVSSPAIGFTSVAFDTDEDYKWYEENVWHNDELSLDEKDAIYFEMTGGSIYKLSEKS